MIITVYPSEFYFVLLHVTTSANRCIDIQKTDCMMKCYNKVVMEVANKIY